MNGPFFSPPNPSARVKANNRRILIVRVKHATAGCTVTEWVYWYTEYTVSVCTFFFTPTRSATSLLSTNAMPAFIYCFAITILRHITFHYVVMINCLTKKDLTTSRTKNIRQFNSVI